MFPTYTAEREDLHARLIRKLVESGLRSKGIYNESQIRAQYKGAFTSMSEAEVNHVAALINSYDLTELKSVDANVNQLATAFGEKTGGRRWGRIVCCMFEVTPYLLKFVEGHVNQVTLRGVMLRNSRSILSDHAEGVEEWLSYSIGYFLHSVVSFRRRDIIEEPPTMEHMQWVTANIKALAPFSKVFMARGTMNRELCDELLRDVSPAMADGML